MERNGLQLPVLKSLILKVVPLSLRLLSKDWKKKNSSEIGQGLRGNFNRERKGRRKEGRADKSKVAEQYRKVQRAARAMSGNGESNV